MGAGPAARSVADMATAPAARRLHFLVATDLSAESRASVAFAARFADALGGRCTVFHCVPSPRLIGDAAGLGTGLLPQATLDAVRGELEELAGTLVVARPVHVDLVEAIDPRAAILEAAERHHADVLVLPTHARTGVRRALLGSVAEHVLRRSPRPVLLLTDRMVQHAGARAPVAGDVVVTTDLSPAAAAAYGPAVDLARRLGRRLHLVSVLPAREPPPLGGGAPVAPPPPDTEARLRERRQALGDLAVQLGSEQPVDVTVAVDDDAAPAIVRLAEALGAACLVVATHGRSGLTRLLLGSTAEQVVRSSPIPVWCVPVPRG